MTSLGNLLSSLKPSGSLKVLALLAAIAIFSIASYATSVSVSTTTYQSQYGVSYNVTGAFTAADGGFSVVPVGIAGSSQPCSWLTAGVCRTAVTLGHYQYKLTLTLNTVPGATTTYTVTVKWDQGSGQTQMGQLTVSVPNTAITGQLMTFEFDTGATSFSTPLSIDVIVA
jgi:hypothetical protein